MSQYWHQYGVVLTPMYHDPSLLSTLVPRKRHDMYGKERSIKEKARRIASPNIVNFHVFYIVFVDNMPCTHLII